MQRKTKQKMILADEKKIRMQKINIIFSIALIVFFAIIFGLSYWVADLHQQTTVSTNGKLLTKNTQQSVSVASVDYR